MARAAKTAPVDTNAPTVLTADRIQRLTCPDGAAKVFLRDVEMPGFKVRCTLTGAKSFVFECKIHGKSRSFTVGSCDVWQISDARAEARRLAVLIDQGQDPAELDRAKAEAKAQAKAEKERSAKYTLEALLMAYCDHLEAVGRSSHAKARDIFKLHVIKAHPQLAGLSAVSVTSEHVADVMRFLAEAGKARTANKLRAYMRSAYEVARRSRTDAAVPVAFKAFGIVHNPVAETLPVEGGDRPDKNPLKLEDMRRYWAVIKDDPSPRGAVLMLHLLTGAQRIEQLLRLKQKDVSADAITLVDGKGRPGQPPRRHLVPLTEAAVLALAQANSGGDHVLSCDGGASSMGPRTFSTWAKAAGDQAGIVGFEAKRLRSGIETALAAAGVSLEVRGHLQSHGVGGVQSRHYDAHDYKREKLGALQTLTRLLDETSASVMHVEFGKAA